MLLSAAHAAAGRVRVYRGATVIDGTGAARYPADVAVEGARIVGIRPPGEADPFELPAGAIESDATGLVLAPGFIDLHAPSGFAGVARDAKIRQGVTCEVIGQDGLCGAPEQTPWRSIAELHAAVDRTRVAHVAVLVPLSDLRVLAGCHAGSPATPDEIARMQQLLGDAIDAGAFGMSSDPVSAQVDTAEIEALCRVVAERRGFWMPHTRSDGDGFREALGIARRTGCAIHLALAATSAAANPGRATELLALVDEAIADSVDVTLDVTPDLDSDVDPGTSRSGSTTLPPSRLAAGDDVADAPSGPSLEEAVRRLSGMPARRLGLDRGDMPRGVIGEGAAADLVLLDPSADGDATTRQRALGGIVEVLVGGVPVVAGGEPTGATPGRALRMPPPPHRATVPSAVHLIDPDAPPFVLRPETAILADAGLRRTAELLAERLGLDGADRLAAAGAITLRVDPSAGGPESFRVTVRGSGVDVAGATPAGVFRGAMLLRQLCDPEHPVGTRLPAGIWTGEPAFAWRGLMLDVARHFRPVADLRRVIDLLAAHQLSVLHLHLTDDQGWRFEVPGYPRLVEVGSVRRATQLGHGPDATVVPGVHRGWYTRDELRELVAYATERQVVIVPEVELPGHVQAALAAYPDLGNVDVGGPVSAPWERFGVNRRTLAPTDAALAFCRAAIDALCDTFGSPWIGIGGDEVPVDEWEASPAARQRMRELDLASSHEVQPWFTAKLVEHVRRRGRSPLAWDEVLAGDVPDGVVVLAWRGDVAMREAIRHGVPVVACPDLQAYLDYPQADSADEPVRVGPPLPIERAYALRVPEAALGGQANLWTEHLPTRDRVDFAMFPRLSAIAERLWVGAASPGFDDFERRLPVHLRRLAADGVRYRPLDGPRPDQRVPGVPGKPMSVAEREVVVAGLVADLRPGPGAAAGEVTD